MSIRTVLSLAVALALVGGAAAFGWGFWRAIGDGPAEAVAQVPDIRSEFDLVDQDGRAVDGEDLHGKWQLVFFGFTACPDICPTTLTNVTAVIDELGPEATRDLQPLLITVDPDRDTPPVLKEYLTSFDPRILGLTGTPEQVKTALRAFRVYAAKNPTEGDDYTVDHSTFIYLMDRQGGYATHFSSQVSIEDMTARLRDRLAGAT